MPVTLRIAVVLIGLATLALCVRFVVIPGIKTWVRRKRREIISHQIWALREDLAGTSDPNRIRELEEEILNLQSQLLVI